MHLYPTSLVDILHRQDIPVPDLIAARRVPSGKRHNDADLDRCGEVYRRRFRRRLCGGRPSQPGLRSRRFPESTRLLWQALAQAASIKAENQKDRENPQGDHARR